MIKKNTKKASIASFDFSDVPSWYALCTNSGCPMCGDCLRYLAASYAPETKETAYCVMPSVMVCRIVLYLLVGATNIG